jgi:hypothetical protein
VRRRWTLRLVAALAVTTALLSGCSSKQQANETLPSAAETSSKPRLEPLGPTDFPVPDEARTKDGSGALAFSRYYVELSNHLLTTLDSGPLRGLSHDCETCNELADGYDADKAVGYSYEGGKLRITSAGSTRLNGDNAEISFVLEQDAVTVRDSSGTVVPDKSSEAYSLSGGIGLLWDDKRATWLVTQLDAERI